MVNTRALERLLQNMICAKAKELYAKYKAAGKDLYAEFIRENLGECFESEREVTS